MKTHHILPILLFIIIVLLLSCKSNNNNDIMSDKMIIKWQNDSLGFNNYRDIDILKKIFSKYNLYNKSCKEIKKYLGKQTYQINYDYMEPNDTNKNCISLSYFCCGYYFDENGDGKVDSTIEFIRGVIEIDFEKDTCIFSKSTHI